MAKEELFVFIYKTLENAYLGGQKWLFACIIMFSCHFHKFFLTAIFKL